PRSLRKFLTFNGESLVAIDLSNSQPLLIILLFKKDFYDPPQDSALTDKRYSPLTFSSITNRYKIIFSNSKGTLPAEWFANKIAAVSNSCSENVAYYTTQTGQGAFYNSLITGDSSPQQNEKIKKKTLTYLYGEERIMPFVIPEMDMLYPCLSEISSIFKCSGHKNFSILL